MAFSFPHADEIRLSNPPLKEVICQVRFPVILKIREQLPASFQDLVRDKFPNLEAEAGFSVEMQGLQPEMPTPLPRPTIYRFLNVDNTTLISVAPDFYALSTTQYTHWDEFIKAYRFLDDAFFHTYQQDLITRIGLRFVNSFILDNTRTKTLTDLKGLFQPDLMALMHTDAWDVPNQLHKHIQLHSGEEQLNLQVVFREENGQPEIILDLDYYSEKKSKRDQILPALEHYHTAIYNAFRWCVTEECLNRFK